VEPTTRIREQSSRSSRPSSFSTAENWLVAGDFPLGQGTRTDLDELILWATTFETEQGRPPSSPDIAKHRPRAYLKYPRFARMCGHRAQPLALQFGDLREWQTTLETTLLSDADDRTIQFIVDTQGGKGKTWFTRYFLTNNYTSTQVLGVGKRDDIAHAIDKNRSIFFFNVGRDAMQYMQYSVLEMIKDKLVFSPKYHSETKILTKNSHVVVLCNEMPNMAAMTADRYVITNLDD
jgi:hypothetical protein